MHISHCTATDGSIFSPPQSWEELPTDIAHEIFRFRLTFREKCTVACVCKAWHRSVNNNIVGTESMKIVGLPCQFDDMWMAQYRNFITKTPHIIALDCSASMCGIKDKETSPREQVARDWIAKKCDQLAEVITHRGIDCIAFGTRVMTRRFKNSDEVKKYFDNVLEADEERVGASTNINNVFEELLRLHRKYSCERMNSPPRVAIISDFEDEGIDIQSFLAKRKMMQIECIRVGKGRGERLLNKLETEFAKWSELQEKKKDDSGERSRGHICKGKSKSENASQLQGKRKFTITFETAEIVEPPAKRQKLEK